MEHIVTIITSAVTTSVMVTVLAFVLRSWIGTRIEQSIKHEHDVRLENFRRDMMVKDRAALLADLLAEWISWPEDRTKLNRLTFEAFLWLPPEIAEDLSRCLANEPEAPGVRAIIGEARKFLLGRDDTLDPQMLNIFPPKSGKT